MQIDVITLFPELFSGFSDTSILSRNLDRGLLSINLHNLRKYGVGKHRITDEPPYGGGGGMVLKPEPVFEAVESILNT